MKSLSPRELQIVALLANGISTKQVVFQLKISRRTVMNYLSSARKKLLAETREHMIAIAVSRGMIVVDKIESE
jgi:DNA-binding CsgD family transcriptional regulator